MLLNARNWAVLEVADGLWRVRLGLSSGSSLFREIHSCTSLVWNNRYRFPTFG